MSDCVHVDQFLPHPPGKVWRALTEPDLIARWLMPGDFRLEVGHRYTMRTAPLPAAGFSGTVDAEVLAFEPARMLRVRWRDAAGTGDGWTITWTLHPEGTGTRLFLLQEGFDPDNPLHRRARDVMADGWRTRTARRLADLLTETGPTMNDTATNYRVLADGLLARIEATPPARWDAPSPCDGWTARQVVGHVVNGHRGILAMVDRRPPTPADGVGIAPMADAPPVEPTADLATAFRRCRDDMLAMLHDPARAATPLPGGPLGPVPVEQAVAVIGSLELLVHTWDLARAVGADDALDPAQVTRTHQALLPHAEGLRRTGAFRPSVPPPPGADPQTAFLCFTGRHP
ncbi:TIGR03086 family protein [Dactylosporangium aurantiacum]|uniref:TIGR03086 family protein n=1 Tax=Dactylosporangium aurantiacum TaxID=35754 RepID=A0A9Q9IBQ3_9ACTN|nr:TIGR03086 family metal-binding protein [Dactylosporangium aurantiacum]MDG6106440.1 TIGR03086 family metal-binding protein [Dactylosporangium aurantiacum]UWZ50524.1 TIGR03086 family protein [Dactylosporangium aurantiacum]